MNNIFNVIAGGCSGTCTCIWDSYLSAWECSADDPSACSMGCGCQTPPNYTGGSTTVQTSCYDPTIPTATPEPATPAPTGTPAAPTATPSPSSTASPATPAPTSPPATPAPTSAPATPAPTSPPATPVPSSTVAPATPAPTSPPATPTPTSPSPSSPPTTPLPTMQPCSYCGYENRITYDAAAGKFVSTGTLVYNGCVNCDTPCLPTIDTNLTVGMVMACSGKPFTSNGCDGCNWVYNPANKMFEIYDEAQSAPGPLDVAKIGCENCGGCDNPPSPDEFFINNKSFVHSECGQLAPSTQPFTCGNCFWFWDFGQNQFSLQLDGCGQSLCNPLCSGCFSPAQWYIGQEEYLYEVIENTGGGKLPILQTGCNKIQNSDAAGYVNEYPKNVPDSGQCACHAEFINDEWEYVCESYGANPCKGGCKCDTQILWNFYYDKNPDDLFNPLIPSNAGGQNTTLPCKPRGDANDVIIIPCSCGNTTQVPEGMTSKTGEGKWMGLVGERTPTGGSYQNDQLQTYVNENGNLVVRKFALGENVNMTPTEFGESFGFIKKIETSKDLPPI